MEKKMPIRQTTSNRCGHEVCEGYEELNKVLHMALDQAQIGKGEIRHGNGKLFKDQPIMVICDLVGEEFLLGQAIKKIVESQRLDDEYSIKEKLGAINYIAASIVKQLTLD